MKIKEKLFFFQILLPTLITIKLKTVEIIINHYEVKQIILDENFIRSFVFHFLELKILFCLLYYPRLKKNEHNVKVFF